MANTFKKEISKQKIAIITAIILISSIWGAVLFLEYKISQNKNPLSYVQVEEDLCFYLPPGCHSTSSESGYSFYCKSGTSGFLVFDYRGDKKLINSSEQIQQIYLTKRTQYLVDIKINEGKSQKLGQKIVCPSITK